MRGYEISSKKNEKKIDSSNAKEYTIMYDEPHWRMRKTEQLPTERWRERMKNEKRQNYLKIKHISGSKVNVTCGPFIFLKCLKIANMLSGARARTRTHTICSVGANDQLVECVDDGTRYIVSIRPLAL